MILQLTEAGTDFMFTVLIQLMIFLAALQTSALQFYSDKGQLASMGANSSWDQRYAALRGTKDRHTSLRIRSEDGGVGKLEDGINNATDTESVAALQALAQNFTTAYGNKDTTASIYDDQTDSLAQGAKGFTARDEQGTRIGLNISHTDISDVDDLVTTLGKENYLAGETQITDGSTREALAHLSGGRLGTMWTTDNQRRGLHTGGYNNLSSSDWRESNAKDSLLNSNNQNVSRINPMNMEYRQLHYTEGNLIALTGAAFAYQQGISVEAGIRRLRERAMHQIDSAKEYALVGADDEAAATWLSDLSVAYLKDDKDAFDVELFGATDAQRKNHSLYAQHGNLVERQLKIGERLESAWSTEFINSDGANKYSQEELNHSRLGALARVEMRRDVFADNQYGSGEAIYAFRDASDDLQKIKELSAYVLSDGIVLNPNDLRRIGRGVLHSDGLSVESQAAVEALGLKPRLMTRESSSWGSGWASAEGHQDIFREAVRYATQGSATPLLVMATANSNAYDMASDVREELGRNLDSQVRDIVANDVSRLGLGDTLNLSRELEYATAATAMKNENFTSQFNQYVQERARNTSLLEDAGANITSTWSGVVNQTGQNWKIAFSDDAAPKYMRENAELGVAMDVLMLAPLVKGAVGTLREVGKQVLSKTDDLSRLASAQNLRPLLSVGADAAQAGLPKGYTRMSTAAGDIVVKGPRGGVYTATDRLDALGNPVYANSGKLYGLEGKKASVLKRDAANDAVSVSTSHEMTPIVVSQMLAELSHQATSGVKLSATQGKTTTILGNYVSDMKPIIEELNYAKTLDFDAKVGGFNVLNAPDSLWKSSKQFWREYNKPLLDKAIQRGDDIVLATRPTQRVLVNPQTGELTGFGREYAYLKRRGYTYDSKTQKMIKQGN